MEASDQRQATKAGSIQAWVAHSKYGGDDDAHATATATLPFRCTLSFSQFLSVFSSIKKRCLADVIAAAVAPVSHTYSLASSERVV